MNLKLTAIVFAMIGAAAAAFGDTAGPLRAADIDHAIRVYWQKEKIVPAPPANDARYLRRVYLDVIGRIPTASEVTAFLADESSDKRSKALEALLAGSEYADNWTSYWDNVLMGKQVRNQFVDRFAWRQWLHTQFEKNVPWNKFVYDVISATGQNSTGGGYAKLAGLGKGPAPMMRDAPAESTDPAEIARVNGAVNWYLKYVQAPADLSGAASKIFLGVQIQCAQCHDHKTEKWKQEDFRRFTACFMSARPRPVGQPQQGGVRKFDVEDMDAFRPMARFAKKPNGMAEYAQAVPAVLDGTELGTGANRRKDLAAWMTARENKWFADAIVNRMWAHFMGRGIVEPIDDFRPSNPATMPNVLKMMADDFVLHDYDLKHLVKQIASTQVYNLSSATAKHLDPGNMYYARYRLKPLGSEQLLDSLVSATNMKPMMERMAGGNLEAVKFQLMRQFTFLFDTDEESEQKDFEGTIPQALMLLNGNLVNKGVSPIPGTALAEVLAMPGVDKEKIEALYLRTLSRKPTAAELARWTDFIKAPRSVVNSGPESIDNTPLRQRLRQMQQQGGGKRNPGGIDPFARLGERVQTAAANPQNQAYEDLFWALLNSSEFAFNH